MIFDKLFKKDKAPVTEKQTEQSAKVDYYAEGVAHFNAGHYTQAMEYFQAAVSENPESSHPYLKLAESYKAIGKQKEAIATLYRLLASDPYNSSAQKMLQEMQQQFQTEADVLSNKSAQKVSTVGQDKVAFNLDDEFERIKRKTQQQNNDDPHFTVIDTSINSSSPRTNYGASEPYNPHLDLADYKIPDFDLLADSDEFKQLLQSDEYQQSSAKIPIVMGVGDDGKPIVEDLTKMPHLLIAGMTNYGGPTFLNGLLLSILFKNHPSDVRLVLMGDKRLQLTSWPQLERHFLTTVEGHEDTPVVDDSKNALRVFKSLGIEMDARFALLKAAKVRKFDEYNELFCQRKLNPQFGHRYLSRIITVVFELNGLLNKETEEEICRLAHLAHAVGIHLVLLTNQPLLFTPEIQVNTPTRLAFKVSRLAESNAILGGSGAQNLKQIGEAIYSSPYESAKHLQCQSISEDDVDNVIGFISKQRGYPYTFGLPEFYFEDERKPFDSRNKDEFFNDAARLVVASQFGSTSLLQRKLQLGYNRAGRIIDQLEAAGIVGPYNGSKVRDVLIRDEAFLEDLLS